MDAVRGGTTSPAFRDDINMPREHIEMVFEVDVSARQQAPVHFGACCLRMSAPRPKTLLEQSPSICRSNKLPIEVRNYQSDFQIVSAGRQSAGLRPIAQQAIYDMIATSVLVRWG